MNAVPPHRARTPWRRNRVVAILCALLLGGIGAHKFYLGRPGWGIVYVLFCWTAIPMVVAVIETILYLLTNDSEFDAYYN